MSGVDAAAAVDAGHALTASQARRGARRQEWLMPLSVVELQSDVWSSTPRPRVRTMQARPPIGRSRSRCLRACCR